MIQHVPFYMAYQQYFNPVEWDEDSISQRDYEYMKCTYPDVVKQLLPYVEKECDRLEYMGSVMYDEYPDRMQLHLMCKRIFDMAKMQIDMDLIWVVLWQEILKRRKEYRKYRKKFY